MIVEQAVALVGAKARVPESSNDNGFRFIRFPILSGNSKRIGQSLRYQGNRFKETLDFPARGNWARTQRDNEAFEQMF